MSIIIAGDRSGTGKTTVTLALLAALRKKNQAVQSFKVGPDYIDPMFHAAVTGRSCYNLDPILTSEAYVRQSYSEHCANAQSGVVEGVMGLFDGATGIDDTGSTAHVARLLGMPVLLVIDCARMARSLAALVHGYKTFDPQINIAGVVLNRVGSDRHLELISEALSAIDMPIVGVFRRESDIQLPSRHLGLVPTEEVDQFQQIALRLADLGERCFDWTWLDRHLAVEKVQPVSEKTATKQVRIAIARDEAFSFYYPDNLEALQAEGAELIYWSPLRDEHLPDADGLYFGGGFPEVFASSLSQNQAALRAVRQAIGQNMPTYAECGGLMYLSQLLTDFEGHSWPMVGAIPQAVKMDNKLTLGYRRAIAKENGPLLEKNQSVIGHEFHKSHIVESKNRSAYASSAYEIKKYWSQTVRTKAEGYISLNMQASYVHLNWSHRPEIAKRFVQKCLASKTSLQSA